MEDVAPNQPCIKGSVIKDPRDWMRTAYGADAYEKALSTLTPDERALIDGQLLAGAWYSVVVWDRFCNAMRAEALQRRGESDLQFDMRNMREAGSKIVRGVYKFVLGLMSAKSAIERVNIVFNRIYSEGRCSVVSNEPGKAVLRFSDATPALRTNLTHNFATSVMYVLELNGARQVDGRISRDEVVDGKLIFEVMLTYAA